MSKQIRVLHFSSHFEDCGIAKYQEQYLDGMKKVDGMHNEFFKYSPYQTRVMKPEEFKTVLDELEAALSEFDILHIQHEFGFYNQDEFARLINIAKNKGKRVIVSYHTSLFVAIKPLKLGGLGPRSILAYIRHARGQKIFLKRHVTPLHSVDAILVHNEATAESLETYGVPKKLITTLAHPVPNLTNPTPSTFIADKLHKKKGDVIYAVVGFLHKYKGVDAAIKALKYLPDNYKLAILGGLHPITDNIAIYDKLTDLIDALGLNDRVYIVGYVKDDDLLNSYIREVDVCVYPYDRVYYANVSSGALNLAFANQRPVITYPTRTFKEVAQHGDPLVLCDTFAYYELARELQRIDVASQVDKVTAYAEAYAWDTMSVKLAEIYKRILYGAENK